MHIQEIIEQSSATAIRHHESARIAYLADATVQYVLITQSTLDEYKRARHIASANDDEEAFEQLCGEYFEYRVQQIPEFLQEQTAAVGCRERVYTGDTGRLAGYEVILPDQANSVTVSASVANKTWMARPRAADDKMLFDSYLPDLAKFAREAAERVYVLESYLILNSEQVDELSSDYDHSQATLFNGQYATFSEVRERLRKALQNISDRVPAAT